MAGDLNPAIQFLQGKWEEAQRKADELLSALNVLRAETGLAAFQGGLAAPNAGAAGSATLATITNDTFYSKPQQRAIREYLEMRKAANLGPAKPREIYDALVQGGYEYEAKSPDIAMVGLRALLRKRTHVFHKLPNGTYGLTAWYPNAKKASPKGGPDSEHETPEGDTIELVDAASAASDEDAADD